MSKISFSFYDISFKRKGTGFWVACQGEIANNSTKSYQSAVFRLLVFERSTVMWTGVIRITAFRRGQTRSFELIMEGLNCRSLPAISKYEIYFESGY